ncbi:MAG: enoyl-CoA hydratase/isomerase family protein [Actinobacteria bacterium]|nr:enoyl-CoA hydratase/isomerase family protein [Actinomycetota bacterium]
MPDAASVRVQRDGRGIVTVTLERPEVRNAFDAALLAGLRATFSEVADDHGVRVVVLTGAGPTFCAGADLRWMRRAADRSVDDNLRDARELEATLRTVHDCPHPVVARVNGHAFGGGIGLLACADVVVAGRGARFGFGEVRVGLAPAVIAPYVVRRTGPARGRRLFLTGERFDAEAGVRFGLVDHAVADDELDTAVADVVGDLLRGGPEAQREVKALVARVTATASLEDAAAITTEAISRLRVSAEAQDGMLAFLEKRPAAWAPDD